jgi:dolichol-phosphate mannosyltransferase
MKAVIIIPTYNEKGNIEKLITVLEEEIFPKIKDEMAILIADDSSPDKTADIVKGLMGKYKNLDLIVGKKEGLGAAYIRGMTYAIEKMNIDVMFEMDADFFHDPTKIPEFLEQLKQGKDFVIGTRYSKGGSIPKDWGIHRKFLSVFGNMFIRLLFGKKGINDWTGGYRAIKKEVFLKEKEKLGEFTGYTFQVGFLYNAVKDGFKVEEVPFNAKDRVLGKSKIPGLETIIKTLYFVIKVRIHELIFGTFGKFLVVGGTGFIIQAVILKILVEGFKADPSLSNILGAVVAIFSNFNLNNWWTFHKDKVTGVGRYFLKLLSFYATSAIGVLVIQTGTIYLGDHLFGRENYFIYFIAGTAVLMVYNFSMYRFVIWRKKPHN